MAHGAQWDFISAPSELFVPPPPPPSCTTQPWAMESAKNRLSKCWKRKDAEVPQSSESLPAGVSENS